MRTTVNHSRSMRTALLFIAFLLTVSVLYHWGTAAQAQAGKLTTQDYIDIQQLFARYYHTLDVKDGEGYASNFTDDGELVLNSGTQKGRAALVKYGREGIVPHQVHSVSNLLITPSPEGATIKSYVQSLKLDDNKQPIFNGPPSVSDDVVVKTPQGWRIKTRRLKTSNLLLSGTK
jgi:hypothetical protein